jgi:hypothetical protein
MKTKPIDSKSAKTALESDVQNIIARAQTGHTLTNRQRLILEAHTSGQTAPLPSANFAKNYAALADAVGRSRQSLVVLAERQDAPKPRPDGRHSISDWQKFLARHGDESEPQALADARLRGEVLDNMRKELRLAALQREFIPKVEVFRVCGQAIQAAKTRSFSGLPRLVTLTRLAKDDEAALKAAREEMIAVWRSMESCDWFKPEVSK